jgi:hypothetical protein
MMRSQRCGHSENFRSIEGARWDRHLAVGLAMVGSGRSRPPLAEV